MKFQRIELENFASYYGKVGPIHLATDENKPLVIFIGQTGFGKTSLFDAINWALYGEEYEKDLLFSKSRDIVDYVNEKALKEAANRGQKLEMSVSLHFEHEGEEETSAYREYYISRSISIRPTTDKEGNVKADIQSRDAYLREITPKGDHQPIEYTRQFLDELLPSNVKSYFLFDGDRIHNLAKPGNSQEVQDAIYRVVDLEIIRNASEHLNDAALDFGKRAAKAAKGELAKVEEDYNEELTILKNLKASLSTIRKERQAIKDQIDRIDAKLKDLPETKALQERKNQASRDLNKNQEAQLEIKNRIRTHAAKAALSVFILPLQNLRDTLKEKRAKGEIPKHIRETFFQDLFHLKECICGTHFELKEEDPIYATLKMRSESEKDRSQEEDQLIDLYHQLSQAEVNINEAKTQLETAENALIEFEKEEKKLRYELQEIDDELGKVPVEDIEVLWRERKKREEKDRDLVAQLTTEQNKVPVSEQRLKELDHERKELGKRQQEAGALHYRSELAQRAANKLNSLYDAFAEQSRQAVEELTVEEFKRFVISSSGYKVALSDDYSLEVLDSNGNKALQRLSMGQSQCLSLAFITAISRVSKKNPPLVIDMPFSRLDHSVHDAVSKRLKELSQQTILFLIPDVEWNNTTRPNLQQYAKHIYELEFNENDRQTILTPYYQ